MNVIYQPNIIKKSEELIEALKDAEFFSENEITNLTFGKNYICDLLTKKLISGDFDDNEIGVFTESEFDQLLKDIIIGSCLYQLKEKGYINSYEDEDTEEIFFLTNEGKDLMKTLNKNENQ